MTRQEILTSKEAFQAAISNFPKGEWRFWSDGKISIAPGTGAVEVTPSKNASSGFPKGEMVHIPLNWWPNNIHGKGFVDSDRSSAYMLHILLINWS